LSADKLAGIAKLAEELDIMLTSDKEALFGTKELEEIRPTAADYLGENSLKMEKLLKLADILYKADVDDLTSSANMAKTIPVVSRDAVMSVSLYMGTDLPSSGLAGQMKALNFAASEINENTYPGAKEMLLDMAGKMEKIEDLKQSPFLKDKAWAKIYGVANAVAGTVNVKSVLTAAKQAVVSMAGFAGLSYILSGIGISFLPLAALTPLNLAIVAGMSVATLGLQKAANSIKARDAIIEEALDQSAQPVVKEVYKLAEELGIGPEENNPAGMTALTMLFAPWNTDTEAGARFGIIANRNFRITSRAGNQRVGRIIASQKSSQNIKSYEDRVNDMASTLQVDGKQTVVSPSRVRAILNGMLTNEEARKAMEKAGMTAEQMDDLKQQLGIKEQMFKDTVDTITKDIFNNPLVRHVLYVYEKEGRRMPVNERTRLLTDAFNVIGMVTRSVYAHNPDVWTLAETAARKQTGCVTNMQIDYAAARLLGIPDEQITASRGQYSDERPHLLLHVTFPDGKDRFVDSTPDGQGRVNYVSEALTITDGRLTDKTGNFYIDNYYNFRNLGKGASGTAAGVFRNIESKGADALSAAMKRYQKDELTAEQIRAMSEYKDYKAFRRTAFALDPEISTNREKYLPVVGVELEALQEELNEGMKAGEYSVETMEEINASLQGLEAELDIMEKTASPAEYYSLYMPQLTRQMLNMQLKQYADNILLAEEIAESQGVSTADLKSVKTDAGVNGNMVSRDGSSDTLMVNPVLLSREVSSFARLVGNGNAAQAAVDIARKLVENGNGHGALPVSLKSLVDISREAGKAAGNGHLAVFKQGKNFLVTNGAPDKAVKISRAAGASGEGASYNVYFTDRPVDRSGLEEVEDMSALSETMVGADNDGGSALENAFEAAVMPFGTVDAVQTVSYPVSFFGGSSNSVKALNENTGINLNNLSLGNTQITGVIPYLMSLTLPYATGPPQGYAYDSSSSNSSKADRISSFGAFSLIHNISITDTSSLSSIYDGGIISFIPGVVSDLHYLPWQVGGMIIETTGDIYSAVSGLTANIMLDLPWLAAGIYIAAAGLLLLISSPLFSILTVAGRGERADITGQSRAVSAALAHYPV